MEQSRHALPLAGSTARCEVVIGIPKNFFGRSGDLPHEGSVNTSNVGGQEHIGAHGDTGFRGSFQQRFECAQVSDRTYETDEILIGGGSTAEQ